jgi:integrase
MDVQLRAPLLSTIQTLFVGMFVGTKGQDVARTVERLSPTSLKSKGEGLHHDGRGLYLQVKNGGRSWVLRYMLNGKSRCMGLGAYPDVSLADARREAERCRRLLGEGIDPIEARRQRREATQLEAARSITFEDCAARYIEAHKAGWRNAKHADQWGKTLETYAYPVFGALPVQAIDTALVTKVLDPIWREKTETATRVRQRVEAILDWATAHGYRSGDNPARWRGHLNKLLPAPSRVRKVEHHNAMPYADLPEFFAELSGRNTISAKALAFTILTAARSGETRGSTLGEISDDGTIWTVPGERTKSGREHRVPLSDEALAILRSLDYLGEDDSELLFPGPRGKPLSDTAMRKYLQQDMGKPGLTVHGFRSSFRDWTAECTNVPREIAEAALAHVLRDKTEAAYQRGDMLDRRRGLMSAWAKFCTLGASSIGKVLPIRRASARRSRMA